MNECDKNAVHFKLIDDQARRGFKVGREIERCIFLDLKPIDNEHQAHRRSSGRFDHLSAEFCGGYNLCNLHCKVYVGLWIDIKCIVNIEIKVAFNC